MKIKLKSLPYILAHMLICQVSMARDILSVPSGSESDHSQPPNLVMEPAYLKIEQKSKLKEIPDSLQQKLQYESVNTEVPLLLEREGEMMRTQGAEYEKGTERFITPKPDYILKDEEILEGIRQPD